MNAQSVVSRYLVCALMVAGLSGQSYRLEKLAGPAFPPVHNLAPYAINNRGAIAGVITFAVIDPRTGRTTGADRGFKRNADGVFVYPIIAPGDNGFSTNIKGLNELGMMVGWNVVDGYNQTRGFLYDGEKFTVVDYMPSGSTQVTAINNRNHYAGNFGPVGPENAFVVVDGNSPSSEYRVLWRPEFTAWLGTIL